MAAGDRPFDLGLPIGLAAFAQAERFAWRMRAARATRRAAGNRRQRAIGPRAAMPPRSGQTPLPTAPTNDNSQNDRLRSTAAPPSRAADDENSRDIRKLRQSSTRLVHDGRPATRLDIRRRKHSSDRRRPAARIRGQHRGSRRFAMRAGHGQTAPAGQQPAQRHRIADRRHAQRRRACRSRSSAGTASLWITRSVDRLMARSMPSLAATQQLQAQRRRPRPNRSVANRRRPALRPATACPRRRHRSDVPGQRWDRSFWKFKTALSGNTNHAAPRQ